MFRVTPVLVGVEAEPGDTEAAYFADVLQNVRKVFLAQVMQDIRIEPVTSKRQAVVDRVTATSSHSDNLLNAISDREPFFQDGAITLGNVLLDSDWALSDNPEQDRDFFIGAALSGAERRAVVRPFPNLPNSGTPPFDFDAHSRIISTSVEQTIVHELLHCMGYWGHSENMNNVMFKAKSMGDDFNTMWQRIDPLDDQYRNVVRKSPYLMAPPDIQRKIDTTRKHLLRTGVNFGNVVTGSSLALDSNGLLGEGYSQMFESAAITYFDNQVAVLSGGLYERWKSVGGETAIGLPSTAPTITPMGSDRSLVTQQFSKRQALSLIVTSAQAEILELASQVLDR